MEALAGATETIAAHMPQLLVETIKTPPGAVRAFLEERGYLCFDLNLSLMAIHRDDPSHASVRPNVPA